MVFQCTTLPNGVRVATDTMPHAKSVAVAVTVGVGRRHEKKSEKGLSHMLEHMLFKGTKTRSAFDIVQEFEGIGADPNAQTTMDTTMYHAQSLPEHAGKVVELLSDIIQHS